MRWFSWDHIFSTILLFLILIIFYLIFELKFLGPMKNSLFDFRLSDIIDSQIIPRENELVDTNMIIINSTINGIPLSNLGLARILVKLSEYNPKVIGIKTTIKKSNNSNLDNKLSFLLQKIPNIICSFKFDNYNEDTDEFDGIISSDKYFTENIDKGYENFNKIKDERFTTIRQFMPKIINKEKEYKSFALKIVEKYDKNSAKKLMNRNNKTEFIKYKGHYHFARIEPLELLKGNISPDMIENKIVLIGRISTKNTLDSNMIFDDVYFSPLNKIYTGKAFPDMYGTIIQANIISMILNNNYIDTMPFTLKVVITVFIVYLNMVIFTFIIIKNKKWYEIFSLIIFVIESIGLLFLSIISFVYFRYDIDFTLTIFAIALSILTFEMYNSSLRPLTIKLYYKYFHKG